MKFKEILFPKNIDHIPENLKSKYKLILIPILTLLFFNITQILFFHFNGNEIPKILYATFFTIVTFIFAVRFTSKIVLFIHLINILLSIILIFRITQTGGVFSPFVMFMFLHITYMYVLAGKKTSFALVIIYTITLFILTTQPDINQLTLPPSQRLFLFTLAAISGLGVFFYIIMSYEKQLKAKSQRFHIQEQEIDKSNSRFYFLGKMASKIGHEINTPLGIIQMNAEFIRSQLQTASNIDTTVYQAIDMIEKTVTKISSVVKGLKVIGRSGDYGYEDINVYKSILDITGLLEGVYNIEGIQFEIKLNTNKLIFHGNQIKFHQIITSLLTKIKESLDLTESNNKLIEILIEDENEYICVSISKHLDGESLLCQKDGDEYNLGISKSLVKEMRGQLEFYTSENSEGLSFKIKLPLEGERTAHKFAKKSNQKFKILVVDDDHEFRELLVMTLESFDHQVESAIDGEDALQKIQSNNYDILLTDLNMPRLSGYDLIKKLKSDLKSNIKIIAFTGMLNSLAHKEKRDSIMSMVEICLYKPINKETLIETIGKLAKT